MQPMMTAINMVPFYINIGISPVRNLLGGINKLPISRFELVSRLKRLPRGTLMVSTKEPKLATENRKLPTEDTYLACENINDH